MPPLDDPKAILRVASIVSSVATRHPSMLIAPVPHLSTFAATVGSPSGFRASTIGSHAGFNAVPHPDHSRAESLNARIFLSRTEKRWSPKPPASRSYSPSTVAPFQQSENLPLRSLSRHTSALRDSSSDGST